MLLLVLLPAILTGFTEPPSADLSLAVPAVALNDTPLNGKSIQDPCPHSQLEDCQQLDSIFLAGLLSELDSHKSLWGTADVYDPCRAAYNALWQVLHPDGLSYGEVYTFDDWDPQLGWSNPAAASPIGGSWLALREGNAEFFGPSGITEIGSGYTFHEGVHLTGSDHGDIPGFTETSVPCTGGNPIIPL